MAAGTWKVFNTAKQKLGVGTLNLAGTVWKLALFTSASNLKSSGSALPRGVLGSVTNEVAVAGGYAAGGYALAGEDWTTFRSAKEYNFMCSNLTFTATGAAIADIRFAAIYVSAATASRHLLCYVTLTTAQFTLAQNNTCTVQCPTNGVLMLS